MKESTIQLLSLFIWGCEPSNILEVERELEDRGIDLDSIRKEVDEIIKRRGKHEKDAQPAVQADAYCVCKEGAIVENLSDIYCIRCDRKIRTA